LVVLGCPGGDTRDSEDQLGRQVKKVCRANLENKEQVVSAVSGDLGERRGTKGTRGSPVLEAPWVCLELREWSDLKVCRALPAHLGPNPSMFVTSTTIGTSTFPLVLLLLQRML